ncbi:MAG: Gfo/Idh/MocA family oxidoreductase [Verrucomicrobia bacterium]|nr:Gfo/Idh/MocA family oxidoreductase [Verrucomicrobiota bacterium]
MKRRSFLKQGTLAGAGFMILKSGLLARGNSPNEKLNIAVIGCGGRGGSNLNDVQGENIVALCDINSKTLAETAARFPKARTYADWRKCLEQQDIDAVVCSTTDHTHAFVANWAMNRGKHVYCEKPIAISVQEARILRETFAKNKDKIATQMGTQIHASDNYRRMVELIRGGAIGTVNSAHVWCSRVPTGGSYLAEVTPIPAHINWDLWLGPSTHHPYNPEYFNGGCLGWNRFWDFGAGQIGDMGSHMMDMAAYLLDLKSPTTCEAQGTPVSTDTCPEWLTATWEHPANDWRPAIKVQWYDGGKKPGMPSPIFSRDNAFKGIIVYGDKGILYGDYDFRVVMPKGDMTQYKAPKKEDLIPESPGHHNEWINACKTDKKTSCNFEYSGTLVENNMLALAAYRAGKKLEWDSTNMKAANCPEADQHLHRNYRDGWKLNG